MSDEDVDPGDLMRDYREAAARVGHLIEGVGKCVRPNSRATDIGLVWLLVAELRLDAVSKQEERRGPRTFIQRPAHLPDNDNELRQTFLSEARADQPLRGDIVIWRAENTAIAEKSAMGLRIPIEAYRMAISLMESSTSEQETKQLGTWAREIAVHLGAVWHVNPDEAPEANLFAWCLDRIEHDDPTPAWLKRVRLFTPNKKEDRREASIARANRERDE